MMGGIRLGMVVLALKIAGLPCAAAATELPLGIHK
jgi:hypothetical protein